MRIRIAALVSVILAVAGCAQSPDGGMTAGPPDADRASAADPLVIGETLTIDSHVMGETRRINVFVPTIYGEKIDAPLPVLYMPDGGMNEDFLHVAGLVQILVCNGGMRPFMLVGIQNTQRRRDLTGPTTSEEDKKMAPIVGGSATFRRFIREELMPAVRTRYRTTNEAAIIGESLAGLFVIETLLLEPDLFSAYLAFDPSLWWNNGRLVDSAASRSAIAASNPKSVFIATSSDSGLSELAARLVASLETEGSNGIRVHNTPLSAETHATIYHPAALQALRTVFAPPVGPASN